MNTYFVYLLTNQTKTVLYVGVTNNLERRINEHKSETIDGFTKKYKVVNLVYFEMFSDVNDAIAREKQIKRWSRKKKNALIDSLNPTWRDLSEN